MLCRITLCGEPKERDILSWEASDASVYPAGGERGPGAPGCVLAKGWTDAGLCRHQPNAGA